MRNEDSTWREIDRRNLPAATRVIHFDGLAAGVYQVLLHGAEETEQFATKIIVGSDDSRRATIAVTPFELTGRITLGGTAIERGALTLEHTEFLWRGVIGLQDDGSFRVLLWQRARYQYRVRAPAISTSFTDAADVDEGHPIELVVDLSDGRITGIVRDAATGMPVANATVQLQTKMSHGRRTMRVATDPNGRFDLIGMRAGQHRNRSFTSVDMIISPPPCHAGGRGYRWLSPKPSLHSALRRRHGRVLAPGFPFTGIPRPAVRRGRRSGGRW